MTIFNTIFLEVKQYCYEAGMEPDEDCFKTIAERANIPIEQLDFFLNTLQDIGIIKYSWEDKSIYMTSFGKKQERLLT